MDYTEPNFGRATGAREQFVVLYALAYNRWHKALDARRVACTDSKEDTHIRRGERDSGNLAAVSPLAKEG